MIGSPNHGRATMYRMDETLTCGQRVRAARKAAGLNQSVFAKLVGVSPSTISELESGQTQFPSLEVANKMSEILNKSVRWILTGEDGEVVIPTQEESDLLSMLRDLNDTDRTALIQIARTMAGKPKN